MRKYSNSWLYCFKKGDRAVFLDRKDNVIKSFDTYDEAIKYADENMDLINRNQKK